MTMTDLEWLKHLEKGIGNLSKYSRENDISYDQLYYAYRMLICPSPNNKELYSKNMALVEQYISINPPISIPKFVGQVGCSGSSFQAYLTHYRKREAVQRLIKEHNLNIPFPEFMSKPEQAMQFKEIPKKEVVQQKANTMKIVSNCGIEVILPANVDASKAIRILEFIRGL